MVLLFSVAAAMPMDCTSGTVLATSVAMARANRAVSAFSSASPSMGIFSRAPSHQRRPAAVRVYVRQKTMRCHQAGRADPPVGLHKLLASSMIWVGTGIFMWESSKMVAKRGTTKFSRMRIELSPTMASSAG